MLETLYNILTVFYVPMLWTLVVFHVAVGAIGLIQPPRLRLLMGAFATKGRIRVLGAVLLVLGAMVYIGADRSELPRLAKFLAILFFIDGGVRVVMPTVSVVYTESLMSWSNTALRGLALAAVVLAGFFYIAAQAPPEPVEPTLDPAQTTAQVQRDIL